MRDNPAQQTDAANLGEPDAAGCEDDVNASGEDTRSMGETP